MSPEVGLSIIPFGSRPLTSASGRAMDMLPSPTSVPSTFDWRFAKRLAHKRFAKRLAHKRKSKMKSKISKRTEEQEQEKEKDLIRRVAFVIFAGRVPFDQAHEHPDDSLKTFFSWANLLRR